MLKSAALALTFAALLPAQMLYHGGPVLTYGVTVYPIFYGSWPESDKATVRQFVSSLGGSAWLQWATAYDNRGDGSGQHVQNAVILGAEYNDPYSQGLSLTSLSTANLVKAAVNAGHLPFDPNGIYAVLGAPGVTHQFGDGYHFALGDLGTGTQGLWVQGGVGFGVTLGQSVLAVMSHEFIEATTDPYGTAWYTSGGYECADICGYGRTNLGGTEYQIANYAIPNGGCVTFSVSVPPPPPSPPPPCTPRGKSGKCK